MKKGEALQGFQRLLEIMEQLRGEGGCDWDKAQTPRSLTPYLLEETYEALEAIESEDWEALCGELGDLLLHIVFQARIGEEEGRFDIVDVLETINRKMVTRHPHVFGDRVWRDEKELLHHWESSKLKEGRRSLMDGIPRSMPALLLAFRVQSRAADVGFDWEQREPVLEKVEEELQELKEVLKNEEDSSRIEEELGDLLFALVNLSRWVKVNPEQALRRATEKFIRRFRYIEEELAQKGQNLSGATLQEMDRIWEQSKDME